MDLIISFWWILLLLPVPAIGTIFTFFPEKVIAFRAKLQQNMFKDFNMNNTDIDHSIYSIIFGESYSKRLRDQQETPRKFTSLMIWIRIMGIFALVIFIIMLFIIIASILRNH